MNLRGSVSASALLRRWEWIAIILYTSIDPDRSTARAITRPLGSINLVGPFKPKIGTHWAEDRASIEKARRGCSSLLASECIHSHHPSQSKSKSTQQITGHESELRTFHTRHLEFAPPRTRWPPVDRGDAMWIWGGAVSRSGTSVAMVRSQDRGPGWRLVPHLRDRVGWGVDGGAEEPPPRILSHQIDPTRGPFRSKTQEGSTRCCGTRKPKARGPVPQSCVARCGGFDRCSALGAIGKARRERRDRPRGWTDGPTRLTKLGMGRAVPRDALDHDITTAFVIKESRGEDVNRLASVWSSLLLVFGHLSMWSGSDIIHQS